MFFELDAKLHLVTLMKMENGAYVSPPQLPPQAHLSAAAAFQAAAANSAAVAGGTVTPFQEALMSRMGRPFGLSVGKLSINILIVGRILEHI